MEGVTGWLWNGGPAEPAEAVLAFDPDAIDPEDCVRNARRFDAEVFKRELPKAVEEALAASQERLDERGEPRQRPTMRRMPLSRRALGVAGIRRPRGG